MFIIFLVLQSMCCVLTFFYFTIPALYLITDTTQALMAFNIFLELTLDFIYLSIYFLSILP